MNDSDDFQPEASGKLCELHLTGDLKEKAFLFFFFFFYWYIYTLHVRTAFGYVFGVFLYTVAIKGVVPVLFSLSYCVCQLHHLQRRQDHNRSSLFLWQRLSSPKMCLLSPRPHPLPGTHQMTLSKHPGQQQWGPRVPPSPSRANQLTPPEARRPPALQRAWMPSPLCAGPRASGSLSAIISHQLAIRPQWTGLRLALADRVASFLMAPQALTARWRAAKRTAPPVSLMSSLGLQIRQQQQQPSNYQVVKLKKPNLLIACWVCICFWFCLCCIFFFIMFCSHACFVNFCTSLHN